MTRPARAARRRGSADRGRLMSGWLIAGMLGAAAPFIVVTGLLDDLVRVAIWEALAAGALLVWYGPARRLWDQSSRRPRSQHETKRADD